MRYPTELNVVDLGVGMASALMCKLLSELGGRIDRIEPSGGDPFRAIYPAYAAWYEHSRPATLDRLHDLLSKADVCILGGEDYPGLDWGFDAADLALKYPTVVFVELRGYVDADQRPPNHPAVDLLVQARTGIVFEQYSARPIAHAFPAPTYGAVLHGHIGLWAALVERQSSGLGQIVRTSLQQGASMWWAPNWMSAQNHDASFDTGNIPKDVRQLIFRCADGEYVQLTLGVPNALPKLYNVLGINLTVAEAAARGMPDITRGVKNFFAPDTDLLEAKVLERDHQSLLKALWAVGLAAEIVLPPGGCWDDEQAQQNGIIGTSEDGSRHVSCPIHIKLSTQADGHDLPPPVSRGPLEGQSFSAPLRGIRIIDFGMLVAGPYSSKILAGLGADVIKIEAPNGDLNRYCYRGFAAANQGKRAIGINGKTDDGREVLRRLCTTAHAVQSNFRPGAARRLGLDPQSLTELRSNMVSLETSGYGSSGPKSLNSGLDMIMQAFCGLEVRAAGEGNDPMWTTSPLVDHATGALGAIAILVGLYRQLRYGVATEAETSLFDTGIFLISELVQDPHGQYAGATMMDSAQLGVHPAERIYRAADGWVAITARSESMAQRLAQFAGISTDEPSRLWSTTERDRIAEVISRWNTADLLKELNRLEIWAEICIADGWNALRNDPAASDFKLTVGYSDVKYGAVETTGFNVAFSRSSLNGTALHAPPRMGEHSHQILEELGYSQEAMGHLFSCGAVF